MAETEFNLALPDLNAYQVALAIASANRILIEFLIQAGISRDEIEAAFRAKAGELIGLQYEDNAANLLRMMAGVASSKRADE